MEKIVKTNTNHTNLHSHLGPEKPSLHMHSGTLFVLTTQVPPFEHIFGLQGSKYKATLHG